MYSAFRGLRAFEVIVSSERVGEFKAWLDQITTFPSNAFPQHLTLPV